jgi:hypothetical protein
LRENGDSYTSDFAIDRTNHTCRTPSRNEAVAEAMAQFDALNSWALAVSDYFFGTF